MTLIVENKDITLHFIKYLKRRMLGHITTLLNPMRLSMYDEYFNSEDFADVTNGVKISSRRVILIGMSKLSHKRYETTTHIFINPNLVYPGTHLKIVDLCRVINFGTMSIDSYPIFTETFEHFSDNIQKYKESCIIGLG